MNGFLNINKPLNVGSTKITSFIKFLLRPKKIGHAGTLDPLASGILPIAIGEGTKVIPYLQEAPKGYIFTIKFGSTTSTDDLEGEITEETDFRPKLKEVKNIISQFTGEIEQIPPAYSAIKINGKRSYDLARQGEKFELKKRKIKIYNLEIINPEKLISEKFLEEITLQCTCSKGTYIRSLGRDIAKSLGSLGHIKYLHRNQYGNFTDKNSISLSEEEIFSREEESLQKVKKRLIEALVNIDVGLDDIPVLDIDAYNCSKLQNGLKINSSARNGIYQIRNEDNILAAIVEVESGLVRVKRGFNLTED